MRKLDDNKILKNILELDKKIQNSRPLSEVEKEFIESEQRFDAVYYSNKLEGNKLSKIEARKAILST